MKTLSERGNLKDLVKYRRHFNAVLREIYSECSVGLNWIKYCRTALFHRPYKKNRI
jgi:hypothetical protein